jgi:hypothetical protein
MGTLNKLGLIKRILASFWNLQKYKVRSNKKFDNIHQGETCYIFGNGASLKYYDFDAISNDIPIITCAFGLFDKRLKKKNVKYYMIADSYSLYPIVYNDYIDKIQKNPQNKIFRKLIKEYKNVTFFTSITNSFGFFPKPSNLGYWHHFGQRDFSSCDISDKFSTCSCALDMMIGLARYLGFTKAVVFGCDYLTTPKMQGHFYANSIPIFGSDDDEYVNRINKSVGNLEILVICPNRVSSKIFPFVSFEEYFEKKEFYQTNTQIIEPEELQLLKDTADANIIFV